MEYHPIIALDIHRFATRRAVDWLGFIVEVHDPFKDISKAPRVCKEPRGAVLGEMACTTAGSPDHTAA
jgi:hypothetical protein